MPRVRLPHETDFDGWRRAARALIVQEIAPEYVEWQVGEEAASLFGDAIFEAQQDDTRFNVAREFVELCRLAILHSDSERFSLLYKLLWRLREEPRLLQVSFDPDVARAEAMVKAVRRDLHKMKAFVRFREIEVMSGDKAEPLFVAWFEPSHHIVQASAPFFTSRFTNMRWSILTPEICMHWDMCELSYSPGASKADAPAEDANEALWRAYYRSIFNPARLKIAAMQAQMPKKYWRNLPEAELIADLVAGAGKRSDTMIAAQPTEPERKIVKYMARKEADMPAHHAADAVSALRALNAEMLVHGEFPLAQHATQAVFGTGVAPARLMLLGEQPGEQEDLAGQPFIGPAGKLLDQALEEAGVARSDVYVTNTLKHYKFKLQGTRRVHMVPGVADIKTYLPWLQREIEIVQPRVIVALGAVAARALTGKALSLEANRGKLLPLTEGRQGVLAYHPSFILRTPDRETKQLRYRRLVDDLRLAVETAAAR